MLLSCAKSVNGLIFFFVRTQSSPIGRDDAAAVTDQKVNIVQLATQKGDSPRAIDALIAPGIRIITKAVIDDLVC